MLGHHQSFFTHPAFRLLIAALAGSIQIFAYAPYQFHTLTIISNAILFLLWHQSHPKMAFWQGWCYGLVLFGGGVFWLHISIHQFGNIPLWAAYGLTFLFVSAMALYYGFAGYFANQFKASDSIKLFVVYPLLLILFEWFRGWFLTGFPWLAIGYSQINSPLSALAPVLGVYGVSLISVFVASILACLFIHSIKKMIPVVLLLLVSMILIPLQNKQWTDPGHRIIKTALVQTNVEQQYKWRPEELNNILFQHLTLSEPLLKSTDLILWSETAIPTFFKNIEPVLAPFINKLKKNKAELIAGFPLSGPQNNYFNGMIVLGGEHQYRYEKRHLVPFGEFMPLPDFIKQWLKFLHIPMSDFSAGNSKTPPVVKIANEIAGISICYEDAFGEEVIQALPQATLLINASNDAWFGDSLAPHQHLEMARMRALETGRYMLRVTSTGISAIIQPNGKIQQQAPQFEAYVLKGNITPMSGSTPYSRYGNHMIVIIILAGLMITLFRRGQPNQKSD